MDRLWISGLVAALVAGAPFTSPTKQAAQAACDPSPPGLVSSWQAEGDYTDCNGLNNGTQVGSVPFAPGKIGQAFSFPTPNAGNYVDLGNPASLKFTDAITIAAWIYPTQAPAPSNLRAILVKWAQRFDPPESIEDAYGLWTENGSGGNLQIFGAINQQRLGGPALEPHVDGGTVPLNAWSHVAMTFYVSPTDVNLKVYVNCSVVGSYAAGDHPIIPSDKRVLIGREDSGQTRPWAGLIDQVRVFDRALTAQEISQLARAGDPNICGNFAFSFACPPDTVVDAKGSANRIFTITNTGSLADDYEYSVTDNTGWITPVSGTTGPVAPGGVYTIKVAATGDADCNPSSDLLTFAVRSTGDLNAPQTCTTSLTCSPVSITKTLESDLNPSLCGQKVTFTNRLSQADATGTVTFYDGADPIGTEPVNGGVATLSIATLAVGTHSITASYSGDGGHLPTTSNKIDQVVNSIPTTTTLTGDPNPSMCGQKVTITARVDPPTATGQVVWSGDVTGSATLVNGEASFSIVLGTGTKSFAAHYQGDGCYAPSQSSKLVQVVNAISTTTTLASDPNPSDCGAKVTFSATVDPPAAAGEVNFFDGGAPLGSGTLASGVATLSIATLSVGPHSITAAYKGSGCHAGSSSNKVEQVVNSIATTTALASDPNPSSCGSKVTFTATVGPPDATGEVNFFDAGSPLGAGTLVNGVATLSIATLSAGSHSITATYKGDACHPSSSSNKIDQVVNTIATTTTLTGDPNPSSCGQKVTLTARVDPPTATGVVVLSGDASGSAPLVNGEATFSLVLGNGTRSFTANYTGDACHDPSSSSKLVQLIAPAVTTTTLESSPNPSECPDKVTLTATVAPTNATGEVNFFDGGVPIGSGTLVNGVATLSIPDPPMGTHVYTAAYKGDGCRLPSPSNEVTHVHDCPTPTLLSMFRAEPLSGAIELRWQFGDPGAFTNVTVERSVSEAGPWMLVAAERHETQGVTVAVDRSVEPGRSYWYRLVVESGTDSPLRFGPVSATAGRAIESFELARVWPNPGAGNIHVDFAVARDARIRLSVVDVQGREMAVLAHGAYGPGRYQAVWTGQTSRGPAPVGLYFIRYEYPGKVLLGRLVLAR
jgi:hypothetical protein